MVTTSVDWVPRTRACEIIGRGLGQGPFSTYRLMRLVDAGDLLARSVPGPGGKLRHYVSVRSIDEFLNGRRKGGANAQSRRVQKADRDLAAIQS